jgi:hypothetical protein
MEDEHYGAGSEVVAGSSRSLEDISVQEFTEQFPPSPARVPGMDSRFPVPIEEYRQMELAAREPEAVEAEALAALEDTTTVDADMAVELAGLDLPEDQATVEPAPAAPPTTASFEGIPQTPYRPSDNAIAVGPDRVMLAVNVELAVYSKAGALQFRWPNFTTLFSPVLPSGAQLFDPQLAYDHYAGRWIVVIAARRGAVRQLAPGSWWPSRKAATRPARTGSGRSTPNSMGARRLTTGLTSPSWDLIRKPSTSRRICS